MLHWYMLPITGVTAVTNRLWRGEGEIPRWQWYLFMVVLANIVCGTLEHLMLYAVWLIYFLGYALLPWQAMFSAITGEPPSRQDKGWFNILQTLTYKVCNMQEGGTYTPAQWRKYGVVYGAFRGAFMLPGVLLLALSAHSLVPLAGVLCLCMGLVYYGGYLLSMNFTSSTMVAVPLSELTMGWWHGTYILICASVL